MKVAVVDSPDLSPRDERTRTRIERTLVFVRVRPNMNEYEHSCILIPGHVYPGKRFFLGLGSIS